MALGKAIAYRPRTGVANRSIVVAVSGHHKAGVCGRHGRGIHTLQNTGLSGVLIRRIRGGADKKIPSDLTNPVKP